MKDQDPEIAKRVDASQAGPGGSDYSAFMERGIEALGLMTSGRGGHPDYHDSGDDPAKMEADILGWTGQFVLQGMLSLADETSVNLLIPDRLVQYQSQRFAPPDISGATAQSWQHVRASTHDELMALRRPAPQAGVGRRRRPAHRHGRRPRGGGGGGASPPASAARAIFQGSTATLEAAAAALNFGRVDVAGPDGAWFGDHADAGRQGRPGRDGGERDCRQSHPPARRPALRRARHGEEADHGDRPAGGGRGAAREVQEEQRPRRRLVRRGGRRRLRASAERAQGRRSARTTCSLSVGPHKDRAAATQKLFLAAVKAGWTKDELFAAAGQAAGRGGPGAAAPNNLTRFGGAPGGKGLLEEVVSSQ